MTPTCHRQQSGLPNEPIGPSAQLVLGVLDSAAGQHASGGPAWGTACCTEKIANCFNRAKNEDDPIAFQLLVRGVREAMSLLTDK